jgi:hypothetical protein
MQRAEILAETGFESWLRTPEPPEAEHDLPAVKSIN